MNRSQRLTVVLSLVLWGGSVLAVSTAQAANSAPAGSWATADYLMWWTDGSDVPALITTSPSGTPQASAGVLGQPHTQVLLGGSLNDGMRSGLRLQAGKWLDDCGTRGIEFNFLQLETLGERFRSDPGGNRILTRPFTDASTGGQISELASFTPLVDGSLSAAVISESLFGWGVNYRHMLQHCCGGSVDGCGHACHASRLDFVVGYRGLRLDDRVLVRERLTSPLLGAGSIQLEDDFDTANTFHGVNLGLIHRRQRCRWSLETFANMALGATRSRNRISGRTRITSPFGNAQYPGGLLALRSNIGDTTDTDFTAIFDVGFNLGYRLTHKLTVRAGYMFLFWPDIYRAGEQIDPVINPNLLPPVLPVAGQPVRPARRDRRTDFWAQGINLGIEYRF